MWCRGDLSVYQHNTAIIFNNSEKGRTVAAPILNDRDIEFMLYELFDAESMTQRERYADHNRETFDAAIKTGKTVAEKYFLPIALGALLL